jgi:hypothetical protein
VAILASSFWAAIPNKQNKQKDAALEVVPCRVRCVPSFCDQAVFCEEAVKKRSGGESLATKD